MSAFKSFFMLEFKRFFCKRNIILAALLWTLVMAFVQMGIGDYKNCINHGKLFQQNEKEKVSKFINYTQ
ncbi:MAG TPA: hypothetical protein VK469_08485, partial [Candidatus Kapabacteria bacterium]|nr:hypothetical protein [Candidatus Kapabacteria bacterium]